MWSCKKFFVPCMEVLLCGFTDFDLWEFELSGGDGVKDEETVVHLGGFKAVDSFVGSEFVEFG